MALHTESGIQTYANLHTAIVEQDVLSGTILEEINGRETFHGASLAKLPIAAATLRLVERGQIDLTTTQVITWDEFDSGSYGTGRLQRLLLPTLPLRLFLPGIPISTEGLLYHSIHNSDNMAVLKLANAVGRERIQAILDSWGLHSTTILNPETGTPNVTTASDMASFLYRFGRGELVQDERLSTPMLRWMRTRKIKNREFYDTKIRYHAGNFTTDDNLAYCHLAGYLQSTVADHLFVVLTRDQVGSKYETTYPQQSRVKEVIDEMAYLLV